MVTVRLENITHIYDIGTKAETLAVKDVTLIFDHGGFYALLGPSGCGKTTLMKIIAGLLKPTRGKVYFDDRDVTDLTPRQRNVAMVFQFPVAYDMSVYDNIAFPLRNYGYGEAEIRKRVLEIARLVGIENFLKVNAVKLDPAGRQKVALARALVREPTVFLFDEPLSNLDPLSRMELRTKIKELQRKIKTTMVYVTHDQAEALTLADKIAVMNEGRLIQFDEPENLFEKPRNTFVGFFIGNPGMNFVECELVETGLNCTAFHYPLLSGFVNKLREHGNKFILGIRPEYVIVSKSRISDIIGKCVVRENLGSAIVLHIDLGGLLIKAKSQETDIVEGDSVYVKLPEEKIRIFKTPSGDLVF